MLGGFFSGSSGALFVIFIMYANNFTIIQFFI